MQDFTCMTKWQNWPGGKTVKSDSAFNTTLPSQTDSAACSFIQSVGSLIQMVLLARSAGEKK